MTVAAIYSRKSTDQVGVSDENRSVARQVEHAKAYAARKGWTVDEQHIYIDDGISGAEFATRPGFLRLMNSLRPRPPFQVLVMSEESRLGREQIEVAYALKRLAQAGVRVWLYLEDRERLLESPTDKLLMSVTAFADELERERARQRTYDALVRKARAGKVTGGVVFGYTNHEVLSEAPDGSGQCHRLHVERVVEPQEAAIVRRIFELCAAGLGVKRIAKALNAEGALAPTPRRRGRPRSWAPSSVREVLHRPLYRGEIVWNRLRKRDQWGVKRYAERPETEWIRVPAAELRIVSDDLWEAAHARLNASRASYLRGTRDERWGRPPSGIASKYLLTGMASCSRCGGTMIVTSQDWKTRRNFAYACGYYHTRGSSVCSNCLEAPMEAVNHEVLTAFKRDLLAPEVIDEAVRKALERLRPSDATEERRRTLRTELVNIEQELVRLSAAIASGGELAALLDAVREREQRRRRLEADLMSLDSLVRVSALDLRRLERAIRERFDDWHGLMKREVDHARRALSAALVGRLVFTPHSEGDTRYYEFVGRWSIGRAVAGIIQAKGMVTPAGFEPAISTLKGSRPWPG
jgi:site-specific DNA recombinase